MSEPETEPDRLGPAETSPAQAPTALPSVGARVLGFVAILLAGAVGGFIGYAFAELQCHDGDCTTQAGIGGLIGALVAAGGTAVVVVLTLRAMGEWRTIQARDPERANNRRTPPSGGNRRAPRVR